MSRSFQPKSCPNPTGEEWELWEVWMLQLDEWELGCARSPHIPEELELLHAPGEPDGCDGHQEATAAAARSSLSAPNVWTALGWGIPVGFLF